LIGKTYDGITIAFRGTQTSSPLDWLQNAALFLSKEDDVILKDSRHQDGPMIFECILDFIELRNRYGNQ